MVLDRDYQMTEEGEPVIYIRYPKAKGRACLQKKKIPKSHEWRSAILDSIVYIVLGRNQPQWPVPVYKGTYVPPIDRRQPRNEIISNIQSRFKKQEETY